MYLIWTRKYVIWNMIFIIFALSLGIFVKLSPHFETFTKKNPPTIIIDAGHGNPDGGAVGIAGSIEQEINLKISKKLQEVFLGKGIKVIMTRENENGISDNNTSLRNMKVEDMKKRAEIIKKSDADLFLSIHMNFFTSPDVNGLRVFYDTKHKEIKPLAEQIQSKMSKITGAKTSAVKEAEKSLFLMKNSPLPSILVECGFLSNPEEEKKLNDEEYQSKLAWAIADAVDEYYFN